MKTITHAHFKMIFLIIVSFFSFTYSTGIIAETDTTIKNLKGDELKAHIINYASNHIAHQPDETIDVSIVQLNQNLTLPLCQGDIDISMPGQTANANSVTLSCKTQPLWNIFVPIKVKLFTDVLVSNRLIMAGETLSATDATYEKQDKNQLSNGFFVDEQSIIGQVARYNINPGTVFTNKNIKQLPIVHKNQTITLMVKSGSIEITMLGIAKTDGFLNDTIKVLNPSSKKIIDAIVKSSNQAEINY